MAQTRKTTPRTAGYIQRYYRDTPTDFEHFAKKVCDFLPSSGWVLDLGCGAGIIETLDWRGEERRVAGVDLDPRVSENPLVDDGVLGDISRLCFDDSSFEVVVCVNVFEHLENPGIVLDEAMRVLKPGGYFLIKTPNRNHYIGWVSRLTPTWFHEWYNRLRGRQAMDTFPTYYRFNRFQDIENAVRESGLELVDLDGFEGIPEYLLLSAILFFPGLWYERWVNGKGHRKRYRANLEMVLRKPAIQGEEETEKVEDKDE